MLWYADKVLAAEPKETLVKYQNELYEKFEHLTKEELLQKILSYEFGKLLKKYADVEDLNLPENERGDKKRDIKAKKESKAEEISAQFTTFTVNVGREDGFTPRDLLTIINENVPRKGLEIGSIRVFETNTKFEIDLGGLQRFASFFRNVSFNGLPFIPAEVKDRYGRGKDRERESFRALAVYFRDLPFRALPQVHRSRQNRVVQRLRRHAALAQRLDRELRYGRSERFGRGQGEIPARRSESRSRARRRAARLLQRALLSAPALPAGRADDVPASGRQGAERREIRKLSFVPARFRRQKPRKRAGTKKQTNRKI